ncbi:MAG: 2Fe-2S iron-sulfur cluster-binding protein [Dehalococcoidia bacterium]|nr:2Fe-2S iron-sulfur cluster-binding protein [Dehalococcoidia bacterium]
MDTVNITIDGQTAQVRKGSNLLQAAEQVGIFIPHLCYLESLPPYVGCRMCVVEIEGARGLELACSSNVSGGMVVRTNTEKVQEARRYTMLAMLSETQPKCLTCLTCWRDKICTPGMTCLRHVNVTERCLTCPKNERCELQSTGEFVNLKGMARFPGARPAFELELRNPLIEMDRDRCILCTRCTRACWDIMGIAAIELCNKGSDAAIDSSFHRPLQDTNCIFCGRCVDACPCSALREKGSPLWGLADYSIETTCPYCGVGCGMILDVKDGKVARSTPNPASPVGKGQLCVKGRFGTEFIHSSERLTTPLIKKDGEFVEASWDEALGLIAEKLPQYKGDQFATVASGRITNEDDYLIQKFTRGVMNSPNVDVCARL